MARSMSAAVRGKANFSVSAITRISAAIRSDFVEARKGGGGPKEGVALIVPGWHC